MQPAADAVPTPNTNSNPKACPIPKPKPKPSPYKLIFTTRRDVKSSNILLTREGVAKVGDVGLAVMTDYFSSASAATGTFAYAAPEILMGKPTTEKVPWPSRLTCRSAALLATQGIAYSGQVTRA